MSRWRFILHFGLAALVFTTMTCGGQVFAKSDAQKRQAPADQPREDSEEKEESRAEIGNDLHTSLQHGVIKDAAPPLWALTLADTPQLFKRDRQGHDLSRAPPMV